jgi:F-type H+-transporting ATPase subunit a
MNGTSTLLAATATAAAKPGIHIELAAERIASIGSFPITNTLVTSWAVLLILFIVALVARRKLSMIPGRFQALLEMGYEFILGFIEETLESRELAQKFLPLILTLFLFIFTANLIEFTPGIGSIGFFSADGFVPLFRSVNTDLNVTLALTFISIFIIEAMGIVTLGLIRYGSKFINFTSPINFVVGLIELVSELARFVSFSFRLFGNIFAGEVLIAVVSFFVPFLLPVPLMAFEMFVGLVQAAIFSMLTLFFIKLAITVPEHEPESH